jgi:polysaccharide export outer membrane protein
VIAEGLVIDVLAYNSKVYYVITDGGGYGEQVVRIPITGGENVLDAKSQVNGLSPVSSRHNVWIARRASATATAS